jgi:hypothetical protein
MRMVVEVTQCTAKRSLIEGVEVDENIVEAEKGCERCSGAFVSPLVDDK